MKNPLMAFAGLLVVFGIVSGTLWHELRKERQTSAALRTRMPDLKLASCPPIPQAAPLAAVAPAEAAATAEVAGKKPPVCSADSALTDAENIQVRAAALSAGIASIAPAGSSERDLVKDPAFRQARLTMQRIRVAHSYPGLAEELRLSEQQANRLFELIAANGLSLSDSLTLNAGTLPAAEQMAAVQRQATQLREGGDGIRAQLGEAGFAQYQEYMKTRPARNQAVTMGSTLAAAGQPLNDSQLRALTTVMIAEQQRETQAAVMLSQNRDPSAPVPRASQSLEAFQNRQEESARRTLEAAAAHLSAAQLKLLQDQLDQQAASRRRVVDFARQRETAQTP
jgi:hypothetical protein